MALSVKSPQQLFTMTTKEEEEGPLSDTLVSIPPWSCHYNLRNSEFNEIEAQRAKFLSSLKEILTIDKSCARFLKLSTNKIDICQLEQPKLLPIETKEKFYLSIKECTIVNVDHGSEDFKDYLKKWDCSITASEKIKELDVLPKEVLQITPEISEFIKSCLKTDSTLPKSKVLPEESAATSYFIDLQYVFTDVPTNYHFQKVPGKFPIHERGDSEYLEELIESKGDYSLDLDFHKDSLDPILKESCFHLPTIDSKLSKELIKSWACTSWVIEVPESLTNYPWVYWESFHLEEELEKGIEYRLKAPYMDDSPTFNEPKDPFDLIDIGQRFPIHNQQRLYQSSMSEFLAPSHENELLQENIECVTCKFEVAEDTIMILPDPELYLVERIQRSEQEKEFPLASTSPTVILPSPDTTPHEPSVATMLQQNTNFEIQQEPSNTSILSNTDINATTLNATKMFTACDDLTIKSVTKRSIDDELDTLISNKKKRISENLSLRKNKASLPLIDLLLSNPEYAKDHMPIVNSPIVNEVENQPQIVQLFQNEQCKNVLIFNSSFTSTSLNQKLLKHLDKTTSLEIVEYELGEDDVDFIISLKDGLLIFDYNKFLQTTQEGNLIIQEKILLCQRRYKSIHVLIACTSLDQPENLLYIQTCLSIMNIDVMVVMNSIESISEWLNHLSVVYGNIRTGDMTFDEDSPLLKILSQFDINILLSHEILKSHQLTDFISMDLKERSRHFGSFLSEEQMMYHYRLLNTRWQFEAPMSSNSETHDNERAVFEDLMKY